MKKLTIFSIFMLFTVSGVFAQAFLHNNHYFQESVRYERLSQQAFSEARYDDSTEYAIRSQEYSALSRQFIAEQVAAFRARTALTAARDRMVVADRLNIQQRYAELYAEASQYFQDANYKFNSRDFEESIAASERVLALLEGIAPAQREEPAVAEKPPAPAGVTLVAYYEVRLNKQRRESLWRIAEFDFIYGDPFKWPILFEANRDIMPERDNPSLIHPGMILRIPSIAGEERSGKK
ncbi:MAG: hypothetical protein FWC36_08880 [Spirochaetes bacterium]|nr:hypothetical protein [Spirochaetota bacterium]